MTFNSNRMTVFYSPMNTLRFSFVICLLISVVIANRCRKIAKKLAPDRGNRNTVGQLAPVVIVTHRYTRTFSELRL